MSKIKKTILCSMFLAMFIILNRFLSIKTPLLIISLQYIPIMMSAILLGPKYSMIVGALGDFIGAIIFPFGAYFPGFTFDCAIFGVVYGIFLYNKNQEKNYKKLFFNLIISSCIVLIIINIFIASFWIHLLFGKAYFVILTSRAITQLLMIPIQIVTMYELVKISEPFIKKYLYEEL